MKNLAKMRKLHKSINPFYLFNFSIVSVFMLVMALNFVVQFKVEALQDNVKDFEVEISEHNKQLNNLEIEWVFLTRPSRLRDLSNKYIEGNRYSVASQIKSDVEMREFFASNYEASQIQANQLAGNF